MENESAKDLLRVRSRERVPVWEGLVAWLLVVQFIWPQDLRAIAWVHLLLTLAPLVAIPLGMRMSGLWSTTLRPLRWFYFPTVLLFALAYCLPGLSWTGWAALPWLLWTLVAAIMVMRRYLSLARHQPPLGDFARLCAFLYLPVGSAWALADRLEIHPLGFDDTIVLLTAAHFHYAGFILPLLASFLLRRESESLHRLVTWSAIVGIPLVALGIISTHFGGAGWLEGIFATFMALAGMGLAFWQMGRSLQVARWNTLPALAGSVLLMGSMVLALLYANRSVMDLAFLSIPWMYALHGSMNALACLLLMLQPLVPSGIAEDATD